MNRAVSNDDERFLLQALNRTSTGWASDYIGGVMGRDAWSIATTFTGDVGFVADVTKNMVNGDVNRALNDVAGAVILSKLGEIGGVVAGKAIKSIKDALNFSDSILPIVVKDTRAGVPDLSSASSFPQLPDGYILLKSGGAAAKDVGGLPNGFRRGEFNSDSQRC
ncbi:hypothetical protein [Xanthomonas oryzae]|uniref:hypothetical protein n=1 Tax=Xanthomonas oryzae TaxID=347 RepID=UPI001CCE7757|nr:hypothetical protein [Xanthomonas oryzae]UBB93053.1 hypothetical protein K2I41_21235 [Xanthomonas oryzae pv. oryzicola]WGY44305.1 hypothetical protein HED68_20925 [Xanthomonas oryzae pv. oryzicola]